MNGHIPSKIARVLSFSLVLVALRGQDDLREKSKRLQAFLFAGKFDEAEPLVRESLRQVPEEIYFLSQLDMVLNGQGKYRDADHVRDRIRTIWEKKYKDKWIAKGAPISESSWSRIMAASKDYYVNGAEYFIPRVLEGRSDDPLAIVAFYKVIALPKEGSGPPRIFQLDKARAETNYFLEEYAGRRTSMVATYKNKKPDIRALVPDAVAYLDRKGK
jgi:hypothetical protein